MVKGIKVKKPIRLISILLVILVIIHSNPIVASKQSQQLTQDKFNLYLRKAYYQNNDQLADSLIRNHRLFVKPFVNELIKEILRKELNGDSEESSQIMVVAKKTSARFEKIFGERSLSIGVNYLTTWSKEEKEDKLAADSLYDLGTSIRGIEEEKKKAIGYYQKALDIYRNIGDERGEAEVLGGLGLIYWGLDYETSLSYYQDALTKREKVDDRQLTGNSLNSIGAVYSSFLKDHEKAIDYFERAEVLRSEIGDLLNLNRTLSNKAQAYLRVGEYLNNNGWFLRLMKTC